VSTLLDNAIATLSTAPGVLAVAIEEPGENLVHLGDHAWYARLRAAHLMRAEADESPIRVMLGQHVIVCQREPAGVVIAVVPTCHPVSKSLHRMIRKAGRLPKPPREPAQTTAKPTKALGKPAPIIDAAEAFR